MREDASRYSTVSIVLHWLIAALVIANVVIGGQFEDAEGSQKLQMLALHKSVGVTVLVLTLIRLAWRLTHPWPALPAEMAAWERVLARATHAGFYVLLILIPLLGWSAASAYGAPQTALWGVIPWPNLPLPVSEDLGEDIGDAHKLLVKATYAVIALHVAGALKHHFIDKDDVLRRMLPIFRRRT